jgi:hypothetical protein
MERWKTRGGFTFDYAIAHCVALWEGKENRENRTERQLQ